MKIKKLDGEFISFEGVNAIARKVDEVIEAVNNLQPRDCLCNEKYICYFHREECPCYCYECTENRHCNNPKCLGEKEKFVITSEAHRKSKKLERSKEECRHDGTTKSCRTCKEWEGGGGSPFTDAYVVQMLEHIRDKYTKGSDHWIVVDMAISSFKRGQIIGELIS